MGDEEDPWAIDDSETNEPQTETSQQDTLNSQTEGVTSDQTNNKENVEEELAPPPPPPEDDGYRKPVQLYRHWVRPKFLQYKYMYNYRTNYYDDVIDYLDKKQVGVPRDIPRAQTWAERVLRTNYSRIYKQWIQVDRSNLLSLTTPTFLVQDSIQSYHWTNLQATIHPLAEWHFFATSHGKGPCDGVSGSLKRAAACASLQRPPENQIGDAGDLYEYAKILDYINVAFFSKEEYHKQENKLNRMFKNSSVIKGTHRLHSFVPYSKTQVIANVFSYSY